MLSKLYRLPAALMADFPGKKHVGPCLVIITASSPEIHDRIGVITSKKAFRRAVDRNALKRRLHDTLRPLADRKPHFDYVVIVRKSTPGVDECAAEFAALVAWLKRSGE